MVPQILSLQLQEDNSFASGILIYLYCFISLHPTILWHWSIEKRQPSLVLQHCYPMV